MLGIAPAPTVLIVTSSANFGVLLESMKPLVPSLRLVPCFALAQVVPLLGQGEIGLVVVHVTTATKQAEVKELLRAVAHTERPVACLLLLDNWEERLRDEFLRAGAACCLPRTVNAEKFAQTLDTLTFHRSSFGQEASELTQPELDIAEPDPSFYLLSPQMVEMMEQLRQVVPQDNTLLFTGETGTGKTRLARLIHEMSPRRREPFLVVDCNALSSSLIESELFGHVRGSFTSADRDRVGKFAAAGKGTLVLDEINSLPLSLQSKLLRVVDDRVFEPVGSNSSQPLRARLITITNARLEQEVAAGRFRADLYYRLNVVGFYLPPLRDRTTAIAPLVHKFMAESAAKSRPEKARINAAALRALEKYHWPGNIRELKNVIERAVTLFPGSQVELGHLPEALRTSDAFRAALRFTSTHGGENSHAPQLLATFASVSHDLTLMKTKEKAEILCITEALRKHRNNRLRAARELGISRMALYKKLHKYGLHPTG